MRALQEKLAPERPTLRDATVVAKGKGLKIWNGRGHGEWDHFYVCARSGAEACRLLRAAVGYGTYETELRKYYNANCWGSAMDGIEPEVGVWATKRGDDRSPVKVV
jgi:hypothetical protein